MPARIESERDSAHCAVFFAIIAVKGGPFSKNDFQ